jgi:hypothetical protein
MHLTRENSTSEFFSFRRHNKPLLVDKEHFTGKRDNSWSYKVFLWLWLLARKVYIQICLSRFLDVTKHLRKWQQRTCRNWQGTSHPSPIRIYTVPWFSDSLWVVKPIRLWLHSCLSYCFFWLELPQLLPSNCFCQVLSTISLYVLILYSLWCSQQSPLRPFRSHCYLHPSPFTPDWQFCETMCRKRRTWILKVQLLVERW